MVQQQPAAATSADASAPRPDSQGKESLLHAIAVSTGRAALVGVISGGVAGFLAGGIGSRVSMRVVAAVGGDSIQGLETENGNIVGDITAGGTFFLIVGGAIFGALGGLIYVAARKWLPEQMWLRAPGHGLFMSFIASGFLLDKGNSDFLKFGHPALSVTLFALLPVLYGTVQAPLAEWLDKKLPPARPSGTPAMFYTLASVIAMVPALFLPLVAGGASDPVVPLLMFLALALVYALVFLRGAGALLGQRYAGLISSAGRVGGYGVLGVAAGFGAYVFFDSVTYHLKISF